jgi:cell fate (sporulation/competence/biofilm development) regulator YlbF (YheA/YmcA/DUF963 family)
MDMMWDKAREVGRLLAQSDEYKALKRANERLAGDREIVASLNRLQDLEDEIGMAVRQGQEPSAEAVEEYNRLGQQVQVTPAYQTLESARANFDKVMMRIQEEIGRGIEAGEQSRIILSS